MRTSLFTIAALAALSVPLAASGADLSLTPDASARRGATVRTVTYPLYSWMDPDVGIAWSNKYFGKGVTVTVVDDFSSKDKFSGKFTSVVQTQLHGQWTSEEIALLAPQATVKLKDFTGSNSKVVLATRGLNVINLSYGMMAPTGYTSVRWGAEESSIISYAVQGKAVISKAAGNDAVPVGGVNSSGQKDYLDAALVGAQSAIFAGALDHVGSVSNKSGLAWYSNTAGSDPLVQSHFLVVGVDGAKTGLYGTSFAAPMISGYAAIIGSKFTKATSTQVVNQLLNTARTNTLLNYNPATYGKGEACLSCALAPVAIK